MKGAISVRYYFPGSRVDKVWLSEHRNLPVIGIIYQSLPLFVRFGLAFIPASNVCGVARSPFSSLVSSRGLG